MDHVAHPIVFTYPDCDSTLMLCQKHFNVIVERLTDYGLRSLIYHDHEEFKQDVVERGKAAFDPAISVQLALARVFMQGLPLGVAYQGCHLCFIAQQPADKNEHGWVTIADEWIAKSCETAYGLAVELGKAPRPS